MCKITSGGASSGFTVVSNRFIDEYLVDASGQNLKVYLYILRYAFVPNADISLKVISDALDYTPNQIIKSLKYWQKLSLLDFGLDGEGEIKYINIAELPAQAAHAGDNGEKACTENADLPEKDVNAGSDCADVLNKTDKASDAAEMPAENGRSSVGARRADRSVEKIFPHYSAEQIGLIGEDEHFKYLMREVEKLLVPGTMGYKDINTLAGIYEGFGFSDELIMYLYRYCLSKDIRDHRYIENVATGWAEKNIQTVEQAQFESQFHDILLNNIRKALGISKALGNMQIKSVEKWACDYKLSDQVILAACDRAALAEVDKPFAYASKIIDYWHSAGIRTLDDIYKNDERHNAEAACGGSSQRAAASGKGRPSSRSAYNQFNDFQQRTYSKDEESKLEKKLIEANAHTQEERDALAERLKKA